MFWILEIQLQLETLSCSRRDICPNLSESVKDSGSTSDTAVVVLLVQTLQTSQVRLLVELNINTVTLPFYAAQTWNKRPEATFESELHFVCFIVFMPLWSMLLHTNTFADMFQTVTWNMLSMQGGLTPTLASDSPGNRWGN